ncbi:MAG TPA: hypothetical protein EYP03_03330 [Aquificae bacterium]|nr:hypothetical protein [Aquificota bacterium]
MMRVARKNLGQLLVEKGILTEDQLAQALEAQKSTREKLGQIIVDLGLAKEDQVLQALAEQLGIPYIDLNTAEIDPSVKNLVRPELMERYECVPVRKGDNKLVVAMSDPTNILVIME